MQTTLIVSIVLLWVIVVGLALVVLALSRQVGILHERIAPAGALVVRGGPKVGEQAPTLSVNLIDGDTVEIGRASNAGRSHLVFFLSPTCPVCKTLLPVLKSARRAENDWLDISLASDGELGEQQRFVREAGLSDFPYILSTELGMTYEVGKLPYAILIDEAGVLRSKGLINSREHLESLFEAKERGVASVQQYVAAEYNR